jgi:hypothetical protein
MSVITRTLGILFGMLMFTGLLGGLPTENVGQQADAAGVYTSAQ